MSPTRQMDTYATATLLHNLHANGFGFTKHMKCWSQIMFGGTTWGYSLFGLLAIIFEVCAHIGFVMGRERKDKFTVAN